MLWTELWMEGDRGVANVLDVAAYILEKHGPMTAMKLQKLVYYSQAWHLVWTDGAEQLFDEPVRAWANGPVVHELYDQHRGRLRLQPGDISGDPNRLLPAERETINEVIAAYRDKSAQWLSELTHHEAPCREARERAGLAPMDRGNAVISPASMYEYYQALTTDNSEPV